MSERKKQEEGHANASFGRVTVTRVRRGLCWLTIHKSSSVFLCPLLTQTPQSSPRAHSLVLSFPFVSVPHIHLPSTATFNFVALACAAPLHMHNRHSSTARTLEGRRRLIAFNLQQGSPTATPLSFPASLPSVSALYS